MKNAKSKKKKCYLQFAIQGGPLHGFITDGRGKSLHASPAGRFVPFQTHVKIRYFKPSFPHSALH